jgi:hypothetical protein
MAVYLPQTLENLVRRGVNITVEAAYLPQTLFGLAYIAKESGAHITVVGNYLPQTLDQLALILGNQLTVVSRSSQS